MKFVSKITSTLVLLLSFGVAQAIEPIKSGDVLKLKMIQLVSAGQTFSDGAESFHSAVIQIDSTAGERTYTRAKEDLVLRRNKFFGIVQRNKYVFAADEIANVLPADLSFGQKWKETVHFNSNRCGLTKTDYDVSVAQGPEMTVNVKGLPTVVKTIQIVREGTWYASRCGGSGAKYVKSLFSPELNEIVLDENRTFHNGFLSDGYKMILDSVE
jgi:hypothetical protein